MKGIVFVELLSMAEETFGEEVVDTILETTELPSGGAYTAVGDYSCDELMTLVGAFSAHSGIPGSELQRLFGHWMMETFGRHYPHLIEKRKDSLDMLEAIEGDIHVEVRKLYPNADLPEFDTEREGSNGLKLTYKSPRPLSDFCQGLVEACVERFGQKAAISRNDRSSEPMTISDFHIQIKSE